MTFSPDAFPYRIDTARLREAEAIADLHTRSLSRGGWSTAEVEALLADPATLTLVARTRSLLGGGSVVGFIMLRLAADEAEILTFAVVSHRRRFGIGRTLLAEALRQLYKKNIRAVFLEVDAHNEPARALYRRFGFIDVGERKAYYPRTGSPHARALVMRADLS